MDFQVENIEYELLKASDISRDGVGIELWDKTAGKLIAEIFRNDTKRQIVFYCEKVELPYEIIITLINEFENSVGKDFQN